MDNTEKRFALAGYPVGHSISPQLFSAAYHGAYRYDLIEEKDFSTAFRRFTDGGYTGMNVTAPFKEEAYLRSDIRHASASRVMAANLLMRTDSGIIAYNSDYLGLKMIIQDHFELVPEGSGENEHLKALVIGCGGAGKAAACAAYDCGIETVIANRTMIKAENFIRDSSLKGAGCCDLSGIQQHIKDSDLIIYTLPLPVREILDVPGKHMRGKTIIEASYINPTFHKGSRLTIRNFVSLQKDTVSLPQRSFYLSGRIWLLAQAITGYEIFTSEQPDEASMLDIIRHND